MNAAFSAIRRYLGLIVAGVLVGLATAALISWLTPRTYTSSTSLFMSSAETDDATAAYEGNLFAQQRMASYAALLTSPTLAQLVIDDLALPFTAADLGGRVAVSADPDTVVLDVEVTDSSPGRAQAIAESLARRFAEQVTALETPDGETTSPVRVSTIQAPDFNPVAAGPDATGTLWRGAAIGFVVALLAAAAHNRFDDRVRTEEELRSATQSRLLGRVVADPALSRRHVAGELGGQSPNSSAFRAMAVSLQRSTDAGRPTRSLVVAGVRPGDGASTVAVNLAVSLAGAGSKVILLDSDLRRPRVTRHLQLHDGQGLSDVLMGAARLEAIQTSGQDGLYVLPAGPLPPNPGDLLGSPQMEALLQELTDVFDFVIIDAPPVLPVIDAALMGALTHGCLLVNRYGRTKRAEVEEAAALLATAQATIVGNVLTRVPGKAAVAPAEGPANRPHRGRAPRAGNSAPYDLTGAG